MLLLIILFIILVIVIALIIVYKFKNKQNRILYDPSVDIDITPCIKKFFENNPGLSRIPEDYANECFEKDIEDCIKYNDIIPDSNKSKIRLMTYNVHGGMDSYDVSNEERIMNIINKTNPTVLCVQELTSGPLYDMLSKKYRFGVMYITNFKTSKGYNLCNGIFSNVEIKNTQSIDLSNTRCCGKLDIEVDGIILSIYNTHLEVKCKETERVSQMDKILKYAKKDQYAIICGDFNSPTDVATHLYSQGYSDVSIAGGLHLTSKYGNIIDYIFANSNLSKKYNVNSYKYYSTASDHLPLITDFY